jgi:hypothetical protein
MPPDGQFNLDTLIQDVLSAPEATRLPRVPARARRRVRQRVRQPHPVLAFQAGCALFLVNAILVCLFAWLLRHG